MSSNTVSLARDANRVAVLGGISSSDNSTPVAVYADPVTHRLLVSNSGGGGTPGTPFNSIQYNNAGAFGGSSTLIFNGTDTITFGSQDAAASFIGPNATTVTSVGGGLFISGGAGGATSGAGGEIQILAGNASGGASNGGNLDLGSGQKSGAGTAGNVTIHANDQTGYVHIYATSGITAPPVGVVKLSANAGNYYLAAGSSSLSAILATSNVITSSKTFTFPNISGTFVLTTSFVDNEVVSGSGTTYTLANTPVAGSQHVYAARQRLYPTTDYSISGATITTIATWATGDLLADYRV